MSKVFVGKCDSYNSDLVKAQVRRIFDELNVSDKIFKGAKVAIKPNLLMKKDISTATTTHPVVLEQVILYLQNLGAEVVIVESPGGPYNKTMLKRVYDGCGITEVAERTGATLNYDLSQSEADVENFSMMKKVTVLSPLVDADVVINIAKLKTHGMMVYTGAVKNMFGSVPGVLKAEYHMRYPDYNNFANALIDVFLAIKPSINLIDGIDGMEGHGPSSGTVRHIGVIMGSEDAFSMDVVATNIIGLDVERIPILNCAVERNICPKNISEVELCGDISKDFKLDNYEMPNIETSAILNVQGSKVFGWISKYLVPKPKVIKTGCVGCGECASSCPAKTIEMKDKKAIIDTSKCIKCFCCQELCPKGTIKIVKPMVSKLIFGNRR